MLDKFEKLIKQIEEAGEEFDFFGPVPDSEIAQAEMRLGIKFPEEYKEFLKKWGGGGITGGSQISGLVPGNPDMDSFGTIVGDTEEARKSFNINRKFLIIHADGEEVLWALDCSLSDGVPPVIGVDVRNNKPKKIADCFTDLLMDYFSSWLD